MQILITLPQVAGGKERGVGRIGMRAGEKKGDEKVRRAAERIKKETRQSDNRQGALCFAWCKAVRSVSVIPSFQPKQLSFSCPPPTLCK